MEKEMDLEEWEFLDVCPEIGKDLFSKDLRFDPQEIIDVNYFTCPSDDPSPAIKRKQLGLAPIAQKSIVEKNLDAEVAQVFKDIGVVSSGMTVGERDVVVSQVLFKELEDESPDKKVDIAVPRIDPGSIQLEQKEESYKDYNFLNNSEFVEDEVAYKEPKFSKNSEFGEEEVEKGKWVAGEKKGKHWWEGFGLGIWRWRLNCSVGVAAATICMLLLGGRHHDHDHHQNQKLHFQIYADEKRINQVMQQATRLNQALSAVRNAPMRRAHISFGGYYDGL